MQSSHTLRFAPPAPPWEVDPGSRFSSLLRKLEQEHVRELQAMQSRLEDSLEQPPAASAGAASRDFEHRSGSIMSPTISEHLSSSRASRTAKQRSALLRDPSCFASTGTAASNNSEQDSLEQPPAASAGTAASNNSEQEFQAPDVSRCSAEQEVPALLGVTRTASRPDRSSILGSLNTSITLDSVSTGISRMKTRILSDDLALIRDWKSTMVAGLMTGRKRHWKIRCIHTLVANQAFDTFSAVIIVLNAILLGVDTNWHALNHDNDVPPPTLDFLEWACAVWFALELCLRILGNGCHFFIAPDWTWNLFDVMVVASAVAERVISLLTIDVTLASFTIMRVLRVLRVTRAVRVIRLIKFFREIRMMIMSILKSGTSLTWSLILLVTDMYLFSVLLTNSVTDYLRKEEEGSAHADRLRAQFGSILRANYTLFQAIAGGVSWVEVSDPLFAMDWASGLVFIFFIFFTLFALTNIITGVFVDTAIQSAQGDRDEMIQAHFRDRRSTLNQAKRFFEEAAEGGHMTYEQFEMHLRDSKARGHLAGIGIEVAEARGLFRLLDVDGLGFVTTEDFLAGCMRLKGNARSIDLATLMYENKRLHVQFKRLRGANEAVMDRLSRIDGDSGQLMEKLSRVEAHVCGAATRKPQHAIVRM